MNERFIIVRNKGDVSVLDFGHDLVDEEGSAELFSVDFNDESDAKFLAEELDGIVRLLNEQDKLLNS